MEETRARGVPVVSSVQMLDWLDGRDQTTFAGLESDGEGVVRSHAASGRRRTRPAGDAPGALDGRQPGGPHPRDGVAVPARPVRFKGVDYLVADGVAGDYVARYAEPPPTPTTPPAPGGGAGGATGGTGTPAPRPVLSAGAVLQGAPWARASRRGAVRMKVACRDHERSCPVALRLEHWRRTVRAPPRRRGRRVHAQPDAAGSPGRRGARSPRAGGCGCVPCSTAAPATPGCARRGASPCARHGPPRRAPCRPRRGRAPPGRA